MKRLLLLACALSCAMAQYYTKFEWSACNKTANPALRVVSANLEPMPVRHPGTVSFSVDANLNRVVQGNLKGKVNILRTVAGIRLPVRCYIYYGIQVGSCEYQNICSQMQSAVPFLPMNWLVWVHLMLTHGQNVTCPLTIPEGNYNVESKSADIDLINSSFSWLTSGNFDIDMSVTDDIGEVGCYSIKLSLQPK